MPIEVRQIVVRAHVTPPVALPVDAVPPAAVSGLRAEILAECRAMIDERLRQQRDR